MSNALNALGSWSKRIRTFACRYQKPMPYRLAILHTVVTEGKKQSSDNGRVKPLLSAAKRKTGKLGMASK